MFWGSRGWMRVRVGVPGSVKAKKPQFVVVHNWWYYGTISKNYCVWMLSLIRGTFFQLWTLDICPQPTPFWLNIPNDYTYQKTISCWNSKRVGRKYFMLFFMSDKILYGSFKPYEILLNELFRLIHISWCYTITYISRGFFLNFF